MTPGTPEAIDRARQVDILNLAERQFGAKLKKVTPTEWVGPCPKCGTDRFSINTSKQIFNCRGCSAGGDAIALVRLVLGIPPRGCARTDQWRADQTCEDDPRGGRRDIRIASSCRRTASPRRISRARQTYGLVDLSYRQRRRGIACSSI
jgi:hypothetical protein